jgi:hypothetical protein
MAIPLEKSLKITHSIEFVFSRITGFSKKPKKRGSIIFSVGGKSFGFFFQHSFLFLRIEIEISKLIKCSRRKPTVIRKGYLHGSSY